MSTWGIFSGDKPFTMPDWITNNDLTSQINDLIRKRPKYKISDEYAQNQGLATSQAFGRDRSIQQQETNLGEEAAGAISRAQDVSSSSSGLLNAIQNIVGSKNTALRGLAADEAAIQNQKIMQLYGVNKDAAEEQDKAWNYNVNQPYQTRMNELVQRRKARQENLFKVLDTLTAGLGSTLFGGGRNSTPAS